MAWTTKDTQALYGVERWSNGHFRVGTEGNLCVFPRSWAPKLSIDLREHTERGDRVQGVLEHVDYHERDLLQDLQNKLEDALEEERLSVEQSTQLLARFETGLAGYTYPWSGGRTEAHPARAIADPAIEESTVQ